MIWALVAWFVAVDGVIGVEKAQVVASRLPEVFRSALEVPVGLPGAWLRDPTATLRGSSCRRTVRSSSNPK